MSEKETFNTLKDKELLLKAKKSIYNEQYREKVKKRTNKRNKIRSYYK